MIKGISKLVSLLFHPLFIITYVTLFYLAVDPYSFGVHSLDAQVPFLLMIFFTTAVIPIIAVLMMKFLGLVQSFELSDSKERIGPYIITGIFYIWLTVNLINNAEVPRLYVVFILGSAIGLFMAFFINNFIKISAHGVGMGGALGFFLLLLRSPVDQVWLSLGSQGAIGSASATGPQGATDSASATVAITKSELASNRNIREFLKTFLKIPSRDIILQLLLIQYENLLNHLIEDTEDNKETIDDIIKNNQYLHRIIFNLLKIKLGIYSPNDKHSLMQQMKQMNEDGLRDDQYKKIEEFITQNSNQHVNMNVNYSVPNDLGNGFENIYYLNNSSINSNNGYQIKKKLNQGAFGVVFEAIKKTNTGNKYYALKKINKNLTTETQRHLLNLRREIDISCALQHKNIIKTYGYFINKEASDYILYIVMELFSGENIYKLIKTNNFLIRENSKKILRTMLKVLEYLGKLNIIYRDIKAENIMLQISNSEITHLKLLDFGLSIVKEKNDSFLGTPFYVPPEIVFLGKADEEYKSYLGVSEKMYDNKVDLWALTVLYLEMAHKDNKMPFNTSSTDVSLLYREIESQIPYRTQVSNEHGDTTEASLKSYLETKLLDPSDAPHIIKMLKKQPGQRYELNDLLPGGEGSAWVNWGDGTIG